MWTLLTFVMFLARSPDGLEPTDRLIPAGYTGNPWGPEANRARTAGELPPIVVSETMGKWRVWGKRVLREGDIVFRRADARILHGFFPFSRFLANVTGSAFSHTGIVKLVDGEPWVYDTTAAGPRLQPFYVWILDNVGAFGVKRVRNELRSHIPAAVAFCNDLYLKQAPFDYELAIDDRAYYCVEMTEKAYRASGLPLSEAVRIGDMENVTKFPICVFMFNKFAHLEIDQPVYCPGNERHGIWSSKSLEQVYPPKPRAASRPKTKSTRPSTRPASRASTASGANSKDSRTNPEAEVPSIPEPALPPSNAPRAAAPKSRAA